MFFSYFTWDPSREAFFIPGIDYPILWYSLFFAGGFFLGYLIVARLLYKYLLQQREGSSPEIKQATFHFLDKLAWYLFTGMIIGARLGHVFFYDWPYYQADPAKILLVWEGGLSSHGGGLGILIALWLFWSNPQRRLPELSFSRLLDYLSIATAFVAGSIRIGNFFNQEILGTPSDLPFAVWFGHPADFGAKMPCHPVQLYEAIFYFASSYFLYKFYPKLKVGMTSGLFFILLFTFRFFIEFLKLPQSIVDGQGLSMGQLLSLPFILFGIFLIKFHDKKGAAQ